MLDIETQAQQVRSVAQLISDLATRLDCTAAALREMTKQRDALAAENAALKKSEPAPFSKLMMEALDAYQSGAADVSELAMLSAYTKLRDGIKTPATDTFLAEVRAQGVDEYASKRGFSFQHGSIHAHFGNGDVMVGSVTFENGDAGINFAPVREKTGGVGTHYDWTKGKTAEQVDSVFVIASSNAEGLEVIRDKLADAIAQLRQGAAQ